MQLVPPSLLHPDLTDDRLAEMGELIREVWQKTRAGHDPKEGDGPWGFGCRFYDRLRTRIRRRSIERPWLRIVEKNMHFVFTIGAVPVRFYRGTSRRAKAGYLSRRASELRQHQLAFGAVAQELGWAFRIAIEALCEEAKPRIVLVKQDVDSGYSQEVWEHAFAGGPAATAALPPATSGAKVHTMRKAAVPIAAPKVALKAKKLKKEDGGA